MNFIELNKTGMHSCVIKGIHYPDIRNFNIDLTEQIKIEYLELGNIGNGVKLNLDATFNMLVSALDHITIYLDSASNNFNSNIEWLTRKAEEGVTVTAYDKEGNPIDIEVEE